MMIIKQSLACRVTRRYVKEEDKRNLCRSISQSWGASKIATIVEEPAVIGERDVRHRPPAVPLALPIGLLVFHNPDPSPWVCPARHGSAGSRN